jgi:hypothetical protein
VVQGFSSRRDYKRRGEEGRVGLCEEALGDGGAVGVAEMKVVDSEGCGKGEGWSWTVRGGWCSGARS